MIHKHFLTILMLSLLLCAGSRFALASERVEENEDFTWNFTIGLTLVSNPSLVVGGDQRDFGDYIFVQSSLDLYYKGFFIQTNKHRFEGLLNGSELGYELYVEEDYEIDIISKSYIIGFDQDASGLIRDEFIPELEGINTRESNSSEGLRYIRYLDNAVYWVDIASDLLAGYHDGWVVDGFYSHIIQVRNWEVNVGGGASFFSRKMNNYYFGVSDDEIAEGRPAYEAGSGYRVEFEAIAQYPMGEDWLFSTGATLSHYSSSIANSPLVDRQNVLRFKLGISYVF